MTTRQEQILIHLYGQLGIGNTYEMPYKTTQDGIAEAIGISRSHVAVEIKKLEEKGFVYHLQRHVTASPKRAYAQRMCYRLNALGILTVKDMLASNEGVA
ncbi:MAG: hypothetical protein E7Z62_01745 [Thermoplasmata archaeon]|nr:hypothetical protein [Thermoplasmata archaeon]